YKQVGLEIELGNFKPNKIVNHTHQGSIGNLYNDEICTYKNGVVSEFSFVKVHKAENELIK
ncbi:MAG: argininosuccinate lyase, partial [Paludibacter sp.]